VQEVDAEKIGRASLVLGAGRTKTTDVIDPAAGLSGLAKIGERVEAGQSLATLHAATRERIEAALPWVKQAFVIGDQPISIPPLVLERL
jgi:thymidine phosphorylase